MSLTFEAEHNLRFFQSKSCDHAFLRKNDLLDLLKIWQVLNHGWRILQCKGFCPANVTCDVMQWYNRRNRQFTYYLYSMYIAVCMAEYTVNSIWRPFSTKRNFPCGATFSARNVMSMRSSLLLCVKFPQKIPLLQRQQVENCSTFKRCRTAGKDLNMAVSCWELQWGWYVIGLQLMEGQERVNIIVKIIREAQFTSIWKKQAWREEASVKFTGKPNVTIN